MLIKPCSTDKMNHAFVWLSFSTFILSERRDSNNVDVEEALTITQIRLPQATHAPHFRYVVLNADVPLMSMITGTMPNFSYDGNVVKLTRSLSIS